MCKEQQVARGGRAGTRHGKSGPALSWQNLRLQSSRCPMTVNRMVNARVLAIPHSAKRASPELSPIGPNCNHQADHLGYQWLFRSSHTVPTINQGPPLLGPCFFGKTSNLTGINACLAWSRQSGKLSFLASSLVCGTEC